jgi:hypothetical protein
MGEAIRHFGFAIWLVLETGVALLPGREARAQWVLNYHGAASRSGTYIACVA